MSRLTLEALRLAVLAVFALLAARSFRRWRHGGGGAAAAWLSASFVVLGAVTVAGILLADQAAGQGQGRWPWKLTAALLLLFPYCLSEFTASFRPAPGRLVAACRALTGLMVAWTLAMPAPHHGGRPAFFGAYAAIVLGEWTVFSVVAARSLWTGARGEAAIARRRMRTISAGSLCVNLALLIRIVALRSAPQGTQLAVQAFGLAGAWLFFVGFTPPRPLRALWRQGELRGFHRAQAELLVAFDPESVSRIIVTQTVQLLGAKAAFMTAADGRVLAAHGIADADAATLAGACPSDIVRVPVRGGWLAVQVTPATPLFGLDENELLRALCDSAILALERTELFVRDRASRMALQQREGQLAQAQRLARLGSWEWHVDTGRVMWSAEMYRIYDLEPADIDEGVDYGWFRSRSHPDDTAAMETAVRGAVATGGRFDVLHRIIAADGGVKWLHSRGQADIDDHGAVRLQGTAQDVTVTKEAELALAHQALHDPLTGLPNRALLLDRLSQAAARGARQPVPLAVLFLDLDRFKVVNDGLGHRAGDELLQAVANRLLAVVRPDDTVARLGGDEFVVVCENLAGEDQAVLLADRIAEVLARPVTVAGREVAITTSIGIVLADAGRVGAEELLRDADTAMYQAKENGRARFALFDLHARKQVLARLETEVALRRAVDRDEFRLSYQPEISFEDGRIVGLEALLRWQHPEKGLQLPGQFLSLAEETGLIVPIGEWALEEACRMAASWQRAGAEFEAPVVWVNLSGRQLAEPGLPVMIARALAEAGADPAKLGLEITESVVMGDPQLSGETLRTLKRLGVQIAIDDFGTGFSSLSRLRSFPVDVLKIDRSFVAGIGVDDEDSAIVAAVVGLAHSLGMTAVAEGVETLDQATALRAMGCDVAQGFYFSTPVDPVTATALLREGILRVA